MFLLHVVPEQRNDLPKPRREFGFDNLNFRFAQQGTRFKFKCVASTQLPSYAIATITTGPTTAMRGRRTSGPLNHASTEPLSGASSSARLLCRHRCANGTVH